jgi:uncharacterized heparinase superfamily protein
VWSAFRVARATRIVDRRRQVAAGAVTVTAAHDGFHRRFGGPLHRREITQEPDRRRVADHLAGGPWRAAEARFHLAPDATVIVDDDRRGGRIALGDTVLHWTLEGGTATVDTGAWHPGFNLSVPRPVLIARFAQPTLAFTLRWRP